MTREPKPDFERYMTALHCEEPDLLPLGEWHIDALPMETYTGNKINTLQEQIQFWYTAGFDYVTTSSGILEPVRAPEGMTIKGDAVQTRYDEGREREWALEGEGIITNWEATAENTDPLMKDTGSLPTAVTRMTDPSSRSVLPAYPWWAIYRTIRACVRLTVRAWPPSTWHLIWPMQRMRSS